MNIIMGLLDIDNNTNSNLSLIIDTLLDKDNYSRRDKYIYEIIHPEYPVASASDELFNLGVGYYIILYFRLGNIYKVSIVGENIIDIGYGIYINDHIWKIMINPKRLISITDNDIIYKIDNNVYNEIKRAVENKR